MTGVTPPDAMECRTFFESKEKDILEPIGKYVKQITDAHGFPLTLECSEDRFMAVIKPSIKLYPRNSTLRG